MKKTKLNKRRNPLALNPLLRKGGVHEKSNKAKRQAEKRNTQRQVDDSSNEK